LALFFLGCCLRFNGRRVCKEIVRLFKHELIVYQRVLQDERTPAFREVASSFGYRLLVYAVRFDTRVQWDDPAKS